MGANAPYVEITYLRISNGATCTVRLSAPEYFDQLDEGQTYATAGTPKHIYPHDYLPVPISELAWCHSREFETKSATEIRMEYMNDGRSWVSHTRGADGSEMLIARTWISENVEHLLRLRRLPGEAFWTVSGNWLHAGADRDISLLR